MPPRLFAGRTIHTISIHKMSVRTYADHASHRWVGGLLPLPPARQLLEETISLLVVDVTIAACPAATPGWVGDPGQGRGESFGGELDKRHGPLLAEWSEPFWLKWWLMPQSPAPTERLDASSLKLFQCQWLWYPALLLQAYRRRYACNPRGAHSGGREFPHRPGQKFPHCDNVNLAESAFRLSCTSNFERAFYGSTLVGLLLQRAALIIRDGLNLVGLRTPYGTGGLAFDSGGLAFGATLRQPIVITSPRPQTAVTTGGIASGAPSSTRGSTLVGGRLRRAALCTSAILNLTIIGLASVRSPTGATASGAVSPTSLS